MNRAIVYATLAVMLTFVVFAVSCSFDTQDLFKAKYVRDFNLQLPAAGRAAVDVETSVGSVTITPSESAECVIEAGATVKARTEEKARELAEALTIQTETDAETLRVRVNKPADLKDNALTVDFHIFIPKDFDVVAASKVGSVNITDIAGKIRASADVGSITCKGLISEASLRSNVGSIFADYAPSAPPDVTASAVTNVGSIELTAPEELSAEVSASTNIGSVTTTRPITVVGKLGKSMKGTIGEGKGSITLSTNVGSIEIK